MPNYKNVPKEEFTLWLIDVANSQKNKKRLTHTSFFQVYYFMERYLKSKGYSTGYQFKDRHFGAYDNELEKDMRAYEHLGTLEMRTENWESGNMIKTHSIELTKLGKDYVDRIAKKELTNYFKESIKIEELKNEFYNYWNKEEKELMTMAFNSWAEDDPNLKPEVVELFETE